MKKLKINKRHFMRFLRAKYYNLRGDYFNIDVYRNNVIMIFDKDSVETEYALSIKKELETKTSFKKKYYIAEAVAVRNALNMDIVYGKRVRKLKRKQKIMKKIEKLRAEFDKL